MTHAEKRILAAKRITKIYEMHGGATASHMRSKVTAKSQKVVSRPQQQSQSTNPRMRQKMQLFPKN